VQSPDFNSWTVAEVNWLRMHDRLPKRLGWKFYVFFPAAFYPLCFLVTWLKENNCNPNPAFNPRPCSFMSNGAIAIFSLVLTVVSTIIVAWKCSSN